MYDFKETMSMCKEQTIFTMSTKRKGTQLSLEASYSFMIQRFRALVNEFLNNKCKIKIVFSLYEDLDMKFYNTFLHYHSQVKHSLYILQKGTPDKRTGRIARSAVLNFFKNIKPLYISGDLYIDFITN